MSTYSPNLRIELITTGDQAGTWGTTTNGNLGTLIEDAIAGYTSVSITSANQALTALNGAADQSRNQSIALTTTTSAAFNVYAPPAEKTYIIYNASAYAATIYNSTVIGNTTAAGTGVTVPAGKTMTVWTEGTNFRLQNTLVAADVVGNVVGNVTGNLTGNVTGNLNGNLTAAAPTATTAPPGTNTTRIATTAFVQAATTALGLGTMATQNANNVAITGGSITGITDLAIADGGTGASTAADARTNLGTVSDPGSDGLMARTSANTTTARSIAVSGTGLSITNANGSAGNPTIASNATNANTASTIVARDASGNFSAGTITASLTGNVTGNLNGNLTAAAPTAPTAAPGTNTTQIATTAFVQAATGTLGTMATQNANSVAITGGSITGITDLAIADGGTGASTAANARTNLGVPSTTGSGASGTWGISITGNAATATTATTATDGFGVNQTWQNVIGSRSVGTWYQNTSGKAIQLFVKNIFGGDILYVGPSTSSYVVMDNNDFDADLDNGAFWVVPKDHFYLVNSPSSPSDWFEMR